jgi:Ran GTPase-activating protein (RanGAP) involved in mRNA processing and transport
MSSSAQILSLHGKGLRLDSRADVEPWIRDLDPSAIEEIHLGGNTIGVDASRALADFLAKTTVLKVISCFLISTDINIMSGCRLCRHIHRTSYI